MRCRNHIRLCSEGFSFHTFELKKNFSKSTFDAIVTRLKLMNKEAFYDLQEYGEGKYFCSYFVKHGVRIYLTELCKKNYERYIVKLVVNPRLLMDPNSDYLGIMRCDNKSLDRMEKQFSKIVSKMGLSVATSIDDWNLTRLDLCVNFEFDRSKLPRQMIQLIHRGPVPSSYTRSYYEYPKQTLPDGTVSLKKHSVKFEGRDTAFVIYDKKYQAKREKLKIPDRMDTRGLLRIELQCSREWIKARCKEHSTREIINFLSKRSREYITEYALNLLPNGEYCTVTELKRRINDLDNVKRKVRERMACLVDICKVEDVAWEDAIERLQKKKELNKKQSGATLKRFDENNLCPIPLSKNCELKSIMSIPSILKRFDDETLDMELLTKKGYRKLMSFIVCMQNDLK